MIELFPGGIREESRDGSGWNSSHSPTKPARSGSGSDSATCPWSPFRGWEDEWKRFHRPVVSGRSGSGRPGRTPRPGWPRRDRPRPRVRYRRASDDAALSRAPGHLEREACSTSGCGSGVLAIAASEPRVSPVWQWTSTRRDRGDGAERRGERRRSRGSARSTCGYRPSAHRGRASRTSICGRSRPRAASRRRDPGDLRLLRGRSTQIPGFRRVERRTQGQIGRPICSTRE